jgi:hypothetical protein
VTWYDSESTEPIPAVTWCHFNERVERMRIRSGKEKNSRAKFQKIGSEDFKARKVVPKVE